MALGFIGTEGTDEAKLVFGFDAFDDHLHLEIMGETDDGLDEGTSFTADHEAADEGAVELEGIEGEFGQVGEAGIAGAEVVDSDADAHAVEAANHVGGALDTADGGGFGELDLQEAGMEAGAMEDAGDLFKEGILGELNGGDIDGDLNRAAGDGLPGEGIGAGALHDVGAEGDDQATLFSDRDKADGADLTEARVIPAGEGLKTDDAVGSEVIFRLVLERDLAFGDGMLECSLHREAFAGGAAEVVGVLDDAAFPIAFSGVHGTVGLLEELAIIAGVREDADADAAGDLD